MMIGWFDIFSFQILIHTIHDSWLTLYGWFDIFSFQISSIFYFLNKKFKKKMIVWFDIFSFEVSSPDWSFCQGGRAAFDHHGGDHQYIEKEYIE